MSIPRDFKKYEEPDRAKLMEAFGKQPKEFQERVLGTVINNGVRDPDHIASIIDRALDIAKAKPIEPVTIEQAASHPMAHLISPEMHAEMKQAFSLKPSQNQEQKLEQQAQIQTGRNDKGGGGRFA